ncbi:MAG: hypothetical protein V1725_02670 [archaeon]
MEEQTTDDLAFVQSLEEKLHSIKECTFTPNLSGKPFAVGVDQYTDKKMTSVEMETLLGILDRNRFAFYPINTGMGFAVGFEIANPKTRERLLTFKEAQLPKKYTFQKLANYFMRPSNLQLAKEINVTIINDRRYYDY